MVAEFPSFAFGNRFVSICAFGNFDGNLEAVSSRQMKDSLESGSEMGDGWAPSFASSSGPRSSSFSTVDVSCAPGGSQSLRRPVFDRKWAQVSSPFARPAPRRRSGRRKQRRQFLLGLALLGYIGQLDSSLFRRSLFARAEKAVGGVPHASATAAPLGDDASGLVYAPSMYERAVVSAGTAAAVASAQEAVEGRGSRALDVTPVGARLTFDEELLIDPENEPTWRTLTFLPDLVIGLTSIYRQSGGGDYLFMTLSRIFGDHFNPRTVVVVALTDVENPRWVRITRRKMIRAFPQYHRNGNLQIIAPRRRMYPSPNFFMKHKFKDNRERMKWRTKQNYDVSFLLQYCAFAPGGNGNDHGTSHKSWYLMLEDDIATAPKFDTEIRNYLLRKGRPDFVHAQFTYLGLIGKLFPMQLVPLFAKYIYQFAEEMPVDWLIWLFLDGAIQFPLTPRILQDAVSGVGRTDIRFAYPTSKNIMYGDVRLGFVPKCNVPYLLSRPVRSVVACFRGVGARRGLTRYVLLTYRLSLERVTTVGLSKALLLIPTQNFGQGASTRANGSRQRGRHPTGALG